MSISWMMLMLKVLVLVYLDSFQACTSKLIQGSCFVFGWDLSLSVGFSFVQRVWRYHQTDSVLGKGGVKISIRNSLLSP